MKRKPWLVLLAVLATGMAVTPAQGQIWKKVKEKAKDKIEQKAVGATDAAVDAAADAVKCVATDHACIEEAKQAGKPVVVTDQGGAPLPQAQQDAAVAAAGAQQPAQKAAPPNPGEGAWANYDFVPGERVLYSEDFSRDRVGNFPRRLEFVMGNAEVVKWNGGTWLRVTSDAVFAVPLPEVLPGRFTMEFQVTMPYHGLIVYGGPDGDVEYTGAAGRDHSVIHIDEGRAEIVRHGKEPGGSMTDPRKLFDFPGGLEGHLFNVRVQGDGAYLKMYLEENRVANLPNGDFLRTNKLYIAIRPEENHPVMLGNISINAGGTEMYEALMQDGRFATQGILFDVDSDRIRPESTPTLNEIADMLKSHAELRIRIEGHTDNTGEAAHNQALSEQRAASVKAYLVSKAGVPAARLESQGLGASKPASTNDTPEGRQANRRVELVKL
jgi:OOP family OmpA-OmpF porin